MALTHERWRDLYDYKMPPQRERTTFEDNELFAVTSKLAELAAIRKVIDGRIQDLRTKELDLVWKWPEDADQEEKELMAGTWGRPWFHKERHS